MKTTQNLESKMRWIIWFQLPLCMDATYLCLEGNISWEMRFDFLDMENGFLINQLKVLEQQVHVAFVSSKLQ